MRPITLIALTALLGLSACDASKMGAPLGSKTASNTVGACPAAPTPACPPASGETKPMTMEPEGSTAATTSASTTSGAAMSAGSAHRVSWATPYRSHRAVRVVRRVAIRRAEPSHQGRVHHNIYAGGYTGETMQRGMSDYGRGDDRGGPRIYVTPDVRYGHQGYGYEDRVDDRDSSAYEYHHTSPPPYVAPRMDEHSYVETRRYVAPPVYVAPRPQVYVETRHYNPPAPPPVVAERRVYREAPQAYRYESRDDRYESRGDSSSSYQHVVRPAVIEDNCRCETTQAAGRDRQGFLTWPGKR